MTTKAKKKTLAQLFAAMKADPDYRKTKLKVWGGKIMKVFWALLRTFLIFGLSFILLYPIIYMVSMAFRGGLEVQDPSVIWIPRSLTFQNVLDAIKELKYGEAIYNTITIDIVSSLIQVAICAIVGYGFARFKFKGRGIAFGAVILTIVVPLQTVLIPIYLNYRFFSVFGILDIYNLITGANVSVNLLGNNLAFYLPAIFGMGIRSGLYIFMFRQFFRGLPKELEEAAWIDGCGKFRTFYNVMLPNAKAIIVTVFLFSIVWYWNDYFQTSMFLNNVPTISTQLSGIKGILAEEVKKGMMNEYQSAAIVQAGCLLSILPMLILYMFTQRQFTESIERAGIVG